MGVPPGGKCPGGMADLSDRSTSCPYINQLMNSVELIHPYQFPSGHQTQVWPPKYLRCYAAADFPMNVSTLLPNKFSVRFGGGETSLPLDFFT